MIYRAMGVMSGSSLDGLDLIYATFESKGPHWQYEIHAGTCLDYSEEWTKKLSGADQLSAVAYLQLHVDYGCYLGNQIKKFMNDHGLEYKVQMIASHGHTVFHQPENGLTHQLGDGASIAAITGIPVISDLRSMDVALGGQGAPIVPIGEKKLFSDHSLFLNIGGIANLSIHHADTIGFDICPANKILNILAEKDGMPFDDKGKLARSGKVISSLLNKLNALDYYQKTFPKSLSNQYGTHHVLPLLNEGGSVADLLHTYTEHISIQTANALNKALEHRLDIDKKILVTGGGAFNDYLMERLQYHLADFRIELPDSQTIKYKEALIMALIGVLRWREDPTALSSVTGATRDSIGGAIWSGHQ